MSINDTRDIKDMVPFETMIIGSAFQYENTIYMKTEISSITNNDLSMKKVNAVCLSTGRLFYFDSKQFVSLLNATIVIK